MMLVAEHRHAMKEFLSGFAPGNSIPLCFLQDFYVFIVSINPCLSLIRPISIVLLAMPLRRAAFLLQVISPPPVLCIPPSRNISICCQQHSVVIHSGQTLRQDSSTQWPCFWHIFSRVVILVVRRRLLLPHSTLPAPLPSSTAVSSGNLTW